MHMCAYSGEYGTAIRCSRNYSAERRFRPDADQSGSAGEACALPGSHIHMANGCLQTTRVIVAHKNFLHAIHFPLYLGKIFCFYSSKILLDGAFDCRFREINRNT